MSSDPGERVMSRDGVTPSNYIETEEGYWYSPIEKNDSSNEETSEDKDDDDGS